MDPETKDVFNLSGTGSAGNDSEASSPSSTSKSRLDMQASKIPCQTNLWRANNDLVIGTQPGGLYKLFELQLDDLIKTQKKLLASSLEEWKTKEVTEAHIVTSLPQRGPEALKFFNNIDQYHVRAPKFTSHFLWLPEDLHRAYEQLVNPITPADLQDFNAMKNDDVVLYNELNYPLLFSFYEILLLDLQMRETILHNKFLTKRGERGAITVVEFSPLSFYVSVLRGQEGELTSIITFTSYADFVRKILSATKRNVGLHIPDDKKCEFTNDRNQKGAQ